MPPILSIAGVYREQREAVVRTTMGRLSRTKAAGPLPPFPCRAAKGLRVCCGRNRPVPRSVEIAYVEPVALGVGLLSMLSMRVEKKGVSPTTLLFLQTMRHMFPSLFSGPLCTPEAISGGLYFGKHSLSCFFGYTGLAVEDHRNGCRADSQARQGSQGDC